MILVVADSGPIHYLVLVDAIDVLPRIYDRVVIPQSVLNELLHPHAPEAVRNWQGEGCIHWCMSKVLTVRIAPQLLAKAEARAVQLGLDRAGYVRNLIEQDLEAAKMPGRRRFSSEDLVGAFQLGGGPATNSRVREMLKRRARLKHEIHR